MKQRQHGNGSGKYEIVQQDMGGWVCLYPSRANDLPEVHPRNLSHCLTEWFRQRPQLRLRFAVPVCKDGNTVELHAWYDMVAFPDLTQPAPGPS